MKTVTTLEVGQSVYYQCAVHTIVSIKGRWVKLSDGANIGRELAANYHREHLARVELAKPFWAGPVPPKMETSQERMERIYDEQEIAAYEAGAATPEAPDTVEDIELPTIEEARALRCIPNMNMIEDSDADESALVGTESEPADKPGYVGPMLELRRRLAAGVYHRAPNGQPCCGDEVAKHLGDLTPAQVIRACIIAMALPANPYAHLNIGQQSMNLRNKLRGALKRGEFGMGVLVEAVEEIREGE